MRLSIEKTGWIGAVSGGAVGVVIGAGYVLSDCPPDLGKLILGLLFSAGLFGSVFSLCGAGVLALIALIAGPVQRGERNSANTGQPQSPPSADQLR